jgi:hypothetical protein
MNNNVNPKSRCSLSGLSHSDMNKEEKLCLEII